MTISPLDSALNHFDTVLTTLEETVDNSSSEIILSVLIARDAIQVSLNDVSQIPQDKIIKIIELDRRLKKQANTITETGELEDWRTTLHPPKEHWWWFMKPPVHKLDRLDWLWNALTVTSLTASVSLVVDISSRFLSGGPSFLGSFAVTFQSVLTLLTARGVLTQAGRTGIDKILLGLGIKKYLWREIQFGLSGVLLLLLIGFRSSLPKISDNFLEKGVDNHYKGDWSSAMSDYEQALSLYPDNAKAHYSLGRLYEDLQEFKKAQTQYRLAVQGGFNAAYNQLAKLYIQDKKYSQAVPLLLQGLDNVQKDEHRIQSYLFKNLGWARFKQERCDEAEANLRDAIFHSKNLEPTPAAPHCLLAQVLEKNKGIDSSLSEWHLCIGYADPRNPYEDAWLNMGNQRIDDIEQSGQQE
jgi:tetratricopeptide (TPR) repeat protein